MNRILKSGSVNPTAGMCYCTKVDGETGDVGWNYTASSLGISKGRPLAADADEDGIVVVAGTTPGGNVDVSSKINIHLQYEIELNIATVRSGGHGVRTTCRGLLQF